MGDTPLGSVLRQEIVLRQELVLRLDEVASRTVALPALRGRLPSNSQDGNRNVRAVRDADRESIRRLLTLEVARGRS